MKKYSIKEMADEFGFGEQSIRNYVKEYENSSEFKEGDVKKVQYGKNNGGKFEVSERVYDWIKEKLQLREENDDLNDLFNKKELATKLQKTLRGKRNKSVSVMAEQYIEHLYLLKGWLEDYKNNLNLALIDQALGMIDADLEEIAVLLNDIERKD